MEVWKASSGGCGRTTLPGRRIWWCIYDDDGERGLRRHAISKGAHPFFLVLLLC